MGEATVKCFWDASSAYLSRLLEGCDDGSCGCKESYWTEVDNEAAVTQTQPPNAVEGAAVAHYGANVHDVVVAGGIGGRACDTATTTGACLTRGCVVVNLVNNELVKCVEGASTEVRPATRSDDDTIIYSDKLADLNVVGTVGTTNGVSRGHPARATVTIEAGVALQNGDAVYVTNVQNMVEINHRTYYVGDASALDANTDVQSFDLLLAPEGTGLNTTSFAAAGSGGQVVFGPRSGVHGAVAAYTGALVAVMGGTVGTTAQCALAHCNPHADDTAVATATKQGACEAPVPHGCGCAVHTTGAAWNCGPYANEQVMTVNVQTGAVTELGFGRKRALAGKPVVGVALARPSGLHTSDTYLVGGVDAAGVASGRVFKFVPAATTTEGLFVEEKNPSAALKANDVTTLSGHSIVPVAAGSTDDDFLLDRDFLLVGGQQDGMVSTTVRRSYIGFHGFEDDRTIGGPFAADATTSGKEALQSAMHVDAGLSGAYKMCQCSTQEDMSYQGEDVDAVDTSEVNWRRHLGEVPINAGDRAPYGGLAGYDGQSTVAAMGASDFEADSDIKAKFQQHLCYGKCFTGCMGGECFCDGFDSEVDAAETGADSATSTTKALCLDEPAVRAMCLESFADARLGVLRSDAGTLKYCRGYVMDRRRNRGFLLMGTDPRALTATQQPQVTLISLSAATYPAGVTIAQNGANGVTARGVVVSDAAGRNGIGRNVVVRVTFGKFLARPSGAAVAGNMLTSAHAEWPHAGAIPWATAVEDATHAPSVVFDTWYVVIQGVKTACTQYDPYESDNRDFITTKSATMPPSSAMEVATAHVTQRADVAADYVLTPGEAASVEVTGRELDFFFDRIMVVDCQGVCGKAEATTHVVAPRSWPEHDPVNVFVDRPNNNTEVSLEVTSGPSCSDQYLYRTFEGVYCPANNLQVVDSTEPLVRNHQCYQKCGTGTCDETLSSGQCFCAGHFPGYDTPASTALCLDRPRCEDLCTLLGDACTGVDMHKTLPRCFLNMGCQEFVDVYTGGAGCSARTTVEACEVETNPQLCTWLEEDSVCTSRPTLAPDADYSYLHRYIDDQVVAGRRLQCNQRRLDSAAEARRLVQGGDPGLSWHGILRFSDVTASTGGTFKVCLCDSALLDTTPTGHYFARKPGFIAFCQNAADFTIELGRLHSSGMSCLLKERRFQRGLCVSQHFGGLRCYDDPTRAPALAIPPSFMAVPAYEVFSGAQDPAADDDGEVFSRIAEFCRFGPLAEVEAFEFCGKFTRPGVAPVPDPSLATP